MLAYAPPCCGMLMASLDDSQGPCQVQGAFVTNTNSRTYAVRINVLYNGGYGPATNGNPM